MTNAIDKQILTAAGKALLAQLNAEEKALVIDKMIFANVPNRPEYPQPDDVVPSGHVNHEAAIEQRGRLSVDSVIYSTTLASNEGPFDFNWTGTYCSEYGVLVTVDYHALTPKTADEPGVAGNTLVRSMVLEYKDIAAITNITVDASSWQYNANPRMKKMDSDTAQTNIDQNGKDWCIDDGFQVTPQSTAFNIKAGAGYISGNRVQLEFDRMIQVPNKPSFIYVDAHREGSSTGEQVTLFDFVITAEEKEDYTDTQNVKHFVCKIAHVLADGSVSDLRKSGSSAGKKWTHEYFINKNNADFTSVTDEGALDDGSDCTLALMKALEKKKPVYIPETENGFYAGEIELPAGSRVFSVGASNPYLAFDLNDVKGFGSALILSDGATSLFKSDGFFTLDGICCHSGKSSPEGDLLAPLTPGGKIFHPRFIRVGAYRFERAFGSKSYLSSAIISYCMASGNNFGISEIVDSQVFGGFYNANEKDGIYLGSGANDNAFIGVKSEWNNGNNYSFYKSSSNTINGGVVDRAGLNNLKIGKDAEVVVSALKIRRGGRLGGCNVLVESAKTVLLNNIICSVGKDDHDEGVITPNTGLLCRGNIGTLIVSDGDWRGGVNSNLSIESGTTFNLLTIDNAIGIENQKRGMAPTISSGRNVQSAVFSGTISSEETVVKGLSQIGINKYTRAVRELNVVVRDTIDGRTRSAKYLMSLVREGGHATLFNCGEIVQSESDFIGDSDVNSIQFSLFNFTDDGSTFDISIKNKKANAQQVWIELM